MHPSASSRITMSMRFHLILLASAVLAAAKAMPNKAAEAFLPSATLPQGSIITPAPQFHDNLLKRSIATCGFVRGNSASPVTCPEDYNCATNFNKLKYGFACCNNIECLDNWATCRPYGQTDCMGNPLSDDVCSSIYGSILQCSQDAPSCFRYARSSARGEADTYYSFACGTTSEDVLLLATATNGGAQTTAADDESTGEDGIANSPLFSIPGIATSTSASNSGTSSNDTGDTSSGKSSLSTVAIAVIVLVGVGILVVGLGIGYWLFRKKQKKNRDLIARNKTPEPETQESEYAFGPGSNIGAGSNIGSWNRGVLNGADPNVEPSVAASEYGGHGAVDVRRPMATVRGQY